MQNVMFCKLVLGYDMLTSNVFSNIAWHVLQLYEVAIPDKIIETYIREDLIKSVIHFWQREYGLHYSYVQPCGFILNHRTLANSNSKKVTQKEKKKNSHLALVNTCMISWQCAKRFHIQNLTQESY